MLNAATLNGLEMNQFATNEFVKGMIINEAQKILAEKRKPRWTKLNELY